MIKQEASVIAINGNLAKVEAAETTACPSCSAHHMCEQTGIKKTRIVDAVNLAHARVGQRVIIEIDSSSILTGSLVVFLIPTLFLMGGIVGGYLLGGYFFGEEYRDSIALAAAAVGFSLSAFIIKKISKKLDKKDSFYPKIKEIIS